MKYIVTGGAGFIGSHIVEELAKQDHDVVIIDNLFSGNVENIAPLLQRNNVSFEQFSITDLPFLKSTFKGADGIFHQGAISSVSHSIADPFATNEVNITGTLNVLVAARDCGVRKVVFASSASVYGNTSIQPIQEDGTLNPLSPYAVSKLTGEQYLKVFSELYGLETLSLRYFNVFGPRQDPKSDYASVIPKFITTILDHRSPTIFGDGKQTRDFLYVKDVVQANIRAMKSNVQGVFNIAYCNRMNIRDLAALIMDITGITVSLMLEPTRIGDIRDSLACISRAQQAFGYAPEYTVRSGLEETVAWFKRHQS